MQAVFEQLLPLIAWVVLLLVLTLVTWLFYRLLTSIQRNVAWLQGNVGTLAVKFGGPVAFFVFLLLLGQNRIPEQTLVTLSGTVTDISGKPVPDVWVAPTEYARKTDRNGNFSMAAPYDRDGQYDLVVYSKFDFMVEDDKVIHDTNDVQIVDYPDAERTVLLAKEFKDQHEKPVGGFRIYIEPIVRPQGVQFQEGDDVQIDIERQKYAVVFKNEEGEVIYREDFILPPGKRFELPKTLNLRDTD